jgi:hypothetical protein
VKRTLILTSLSVWLLGVLPIQASLIIPEQERSLGATAAMDETLIGSTQLGSGSLSTAPAPSLPEPTTIIAAALLLIPLLSALRIHLLAKPASKAPAASRSLSG